MKTKYTVALLTLFLSLTISVTAQSDSLSHYMKVAAESNPGLKADFYAYKASMERIPQVGAIPDLQLDMGFYVQPMDVIDGRQVADFTLMQMFPWFGTRKAAQNEAEHNVNMAYEQFRQSRDELFYEVSNQWYVLYSLQQKIRSIEEHKEYLTQLERLSVLKYSSSSSESSSNNSLSSTLRIRLEAVELDNSIETVLSELQSEEAKFNALLNRPSNSEIHIPDSIEQNPFLMNVSSAMDAISDNSPVLGMIREESNSFVAKAEADKKMSMPMIGLGVQYSLINKRMPSAIPVSDMNGMDMIMPMVSISIPIYRNKYKAQQRESKLMQQVSEERYNQTYNLLKAELLRTKHELDDASRTITLLEKQTELANTTYNLVVQEFATGKSDLSDVIQVQRQLLDYKLRRSDAVASYNTLVAATQKLISFNDKTNYNK